VKFRVLDPISFDGSQPIRHRFNGVVGMTAIKKGSPERVKELLRIEDFPGRAVRGVKNRCYWNMV
jgi:hypothetical protein